LGEFDMKNFLQSVWQFCRYLFWPRWGKKREENKKMGHTDSIVLLCHTESTEITEIPLSHISHRILSYGRYAQNLRKIFEKNLRNCEHLADDSIHRQR